MKPKRANKFWLSERHGHFSSTASCVMNLREFLTVGDSKPAFLRARLVTAPAVFGPREPHVSLVLMFPVLPTLPHRPRECCLKWSCDFSHEHRGLPGDEQGPSSRPGKSRTTVTYTALPLTPHANTHSDTHAHTRTHTHIAHDISRWGTLRCINSWTRREKEKPCFVSEWRKGGWSTVRLSEWKMGVNIGPLGSHMSGMRKQQFEE